MLYAIRSACYQVGEGACLGSSQKTKLRLLVTLSWILNE